MTTPELLAEYALCARCASIHQHSNLAATYEQHMNEYAAQLNGRLITVADQREAIKILDERHAVGISVIQGWPDEPMVFTLDGWIQPNRKPLEDVFAAQIIYRESQMDADDGPGEPTGREAYSE